MLSLSPRAKALFLALGIFILGAICGAMGERWLILSRLHPFAEMPAGMRGRPGPPPDHDHEERGPGPSIRRMARDLNLTEEQQTAIRKIMEEYRSRLMAERSEIGEKMRRTSEEIRTKIKAELTEEQRTKLEEIERERGNRWRDRGGRKRGGWEGGSPSGP